MSEHEWKTLLELHDPAEAEIIKAALESQGMVVELFKESAGTIYGLTVGMLGKIEIAVRDVDLPAAQAWLEAYENESLESNVEDDSPPAE